MIITPNTKGHYPKGYPRSSGGYGGQIQTELEQATDTPNLTIYKSAIEEAQSDASNYFGRNQNAWNWWHARWPNQTVDGRRWPGRDGAEIFPWAGSSDTRVRTVEKVIGQHRTLATFALRNMKVQAKSSRPTVTSRESQQATTLLNWMLFTHMGADLHRELRLAISWRNGYGAAVLKVDWEQQRMLDYIDVHVAGLQEFINEPAVRAFMGGGPSRTGGSELPLGEGLQITDLQEMIMDEAYADDLALVLRAISHDFLTVRQARAKLDDLREMRTVQVPIPYVYKSRPRITALRPMVDVIFPGATDDFQRAPWTTEIEFVSAVELRDRIETAGYSKKFVADALDRRGPSSGTNNIWRSRTSSERGSLTGQSGSDFENDIELHHFYSLVHDRGVPVRFCTVFHMDIDEPAKHEPYGYKHGESCFHPMRFEIEDRPILSSRGIAEIAYTWEQEIKHQRDARTDRTDMVLRPPIFTTAYEEMMKFKASYSPGALVPMRRFDTIEKDKPPMWDPGSTEIERSVEAMVREHFGIFGNDIDLELKSLRREEFVDDNLAELKPVIQQMLKLLRDLMPDAEVAAIVGPLNRPFQISREDIQGEFEISATVDLRDIDREWTKERFSVVPQIFATDTQGLIDRTPIIKAMLGWLGYDLAESALTDDSQKVTEAEAQDEQRAIDLIIGSGQDQPLPQGANHQLRLQTLQTKLQSLPQNPATMQIIQANPNIMKVLVNRAKYHQRQLQQLENAQIGRMQVSQTFSGQAPQIADRQK